MLFNILGALIVCLLAFIIKATIFFEKNNEYFLDREVYNGDELYEFFRTDMKASERLEKFILWMNNYQPHSGKDAFVWNAVKRNIGIPLSLAVASQLIMAYAAEDMQMLAGILNLAFFAFVLIGVVKISYPFTAAKRYLHHYEKFH